MIKTPRSSRRTVLATRARYRRFVLIAATAGVVLAASACTSSPEESTPQIDAAKPGGIVIVLPELGTGSLDPSNNNGTVMNAPIYDYWVGSDINGILVKDYGLVKDWTIAEAGTKSVYTLTVRTGAKFHDGSEVSAADLKFSLEYAMRQGSANPSAGTLRQVIESIEVKDPSTAVITTKKKYAWLLYDISPVGYAGEVLPKAYIEKNGSEYFAQHPIGSGPCTFKSKTDTTWKFSAWDGHWLLPKPIYNDCVTLEAVSETSTATSMLQTNEADVISASINQIGSLQTDGFRILSAVGSQPANLRFAGMWQEGSFLSDLNVRKALDMSVDRAKIIQTLLGGKAQPAGTPYYGKLALGASKYSYPATAYNPDEAKKLLQQAMTDKGWSEIKLTWNIYPGVLPSEQVAEAIVSNWTDIFGGKLKVDLRPIDAGTHRDLIVASKLVDVIAFVASPDRVNWASQWQSALVQGGTLSGYRANDPTLTELINKSVAEPNLDRIAVLNNDVMLRIRSQVYGIGIADVDQLYAANPKTVRSDWKIPEYGLNINALDLVMPNGAFRPQ